MMNMMTGAVAINGGVGVMEIHQPQVAVSQMAASAAQAAEQVALNAHITLRELKGMIDTVVEKKLPTFKTLMEMNPVAVARTSVNGAKLTAYENGYAVYEVDSAHTVMAVDRCGDYRYDFTDGTHQIVPAETFEDAEWSLRLLMEGEKRMEHNLSNINQCIKTGTVNGSFDNTDVFSGHIKLFAECLLCDSGLFTCVCDTFT